MYKVHEVRRTTDLYEIIKETTKVFRSGLGRVNASDEFDYVDMLVLDILVNKNKAREYRPDLVKFLNDYPQPERLIQGPSYIELAGNLGLEQGSTLRLMALGQTLGFWEVLHGRKLGISDNKSLDLAGRGFIMISGYNPNGGVK